MPTGRENSLPKELNGPLDRKNPIYLKNIAEVIPAPYMGTSLISNNPPVGSYSSPMMRAIWWS